VIKEFLGIKVGLIGLTYPYVDETMPPSFSEGLSFQLGLDQISSMIKKLREEERVDIVVVVSHMGLPLDVKLASLINEIDIVMIE